MDLRGERSVHRKALARLARDNTTLTEQVTSNSMRLVSTMHICKMYMKNRCLFQLYCSFAAQEVANSHSC